MKILKCLHLLSKTAGYSKIIKNSEMPSSVGENRKWITEEILCSKKINLDNARVIVKNSSDFPNDKKPFFILKALFSNGIDRIFRNMKSPLIFIFKKRQSKFRYYLINFLERLSALVKKPFDLYGEHICKTATPRILKILEQFFRVIGQKNFVLCSPDLNQ